MSCTRRLVDKRWSYGNVLRDGGVGTIEHTEQLTHLLFPKTAHEREQRPAPWTSASLRGTAPGDC